MWGDFFGEKKPRIGSFAFCVLAVVMCGALVVNHLLVGERVDELIPQASLAARLSMSPMFDVLAMMFFGVAIWSRHVWPQRIRWITGAWMVMFVGYFAFSIIVFHLHLIGAIEAHGKA